MPSEPALVVNDLHKSFGNVEVLRDGRWEAGPPMSTARDRACAVVLDGAIYVMGGEDEDGTDLNGYLEISAHSHGKDIEILAVNFGVLQVGEKF